MYDKTFLHNAAILERFNCIPAKHTNIRQIKLIPKNFYSTALETLGNFYKINELIDYGYCSLEKLLRHL